MAHDIIPQLTQWEYDHSLGHLAVWWIETFTLIGRGDGYFLKFFAEAAIQIRSLLQKFSGFCHYLCTYDITSANDCPQNHNNNHHGGMFP